MIHATIAYTFLMQTSLRVAWPPLLSLVTRRVMQFRQQNVYASRVRLTLVPVVNLASAAWIYVFIAGVLLNVSEIVTVAQFGSMHLPSCSI